MNIHPKNAKIIIFCKKGGNYRKMIYLCPKILNYGTEKFV